jgi:tetratricopeptide (TPR) repeat protein
MRRSEAIAAFHRALKANPDFADACVNLGFLEQRQGRREQALEDYGKAARIQPQGPPDYFARAVKLAASDRPAEAIECFRTLIQQVPAFWQARYLLGLELAAAGNNDEAQTQFSEVLRYRPDYSAWLPGRLGANRRP